jgi:hypothetical protein
VRLHFAESAWTALGQRLFDVSINGTTVLSNLDIYATAGGQFKAVIEELTATTTRLSSNTSPAQPNALASGMRFCERVGGACSAIVALKELERIAARKS